MLEPFGDELLTAVAQRAPGCELVPLLASGRAAELKNWLWGRGVIDVLELPAFVESGMFDVLAEREVQASEQQLGFFLGVRKPP